MDLAFTFLGDEKFDFIFTWMKTANLDPEILDSVTQQCYEHLNPRALLFGGYLLEKLL